MISSIQKKMFLTFSTWNTGEKHGVLFATGKHWKCRRESDVNLTPGRQQANRKSGPNHSARYPVLFSRRVVIAKWLY